MGRWAKHDSIISDMEEKNILGRGWKSSAQQLEDLASVSVYSKGWSAAATRIRELEQRIEELEKTR